MRCQKSEKCLVVLILFYCWLCYDDQNAVVLRRSNSQEILSNTSVDGYFSNEESSLKIISEEHLRWQKANEAKRLLLTNKYVTVGTTGYRYVDFVDNSSLLDSGYLCIKYCSFIFISIS